MFFKRSYSLSEYMEKMLCKEPRIDEYRTTSVSKSIFSTNTAVQFA